MGAYLEQEAMTMKMNKWTKWKIGAIGALGMAVLFHEIKDSAAYAKAVRKAGADKAAATVQTPSRQQSDRSLGSAPGAGNERRHKNRGGQAFGTAPNAPESGTSSVPQNAQPHSRTTRS